MASSTVIALFDSAEQMERVVRALQEAGITDKEISILMRDWSEERETGETRAAVVERSAIAGGLAGAAPGLLATLVSLFVPGLGVVRAFGPIVAALGAVEGALIGDAIGEIAASEIPEERSRTYEERLKQGHVLLAVHTDRENAPRAERLLSQHGAQEVFRTV